jgi:CDP-paratose 2-epimerase
MLEWFRPGEHDRVDRVLDDMQRSASRAAHRHQLGRRLHRRGRGVVRRGCCRNSRRRVNVLPCFVDTPPFWGVAPEDQRPAGNLKSYADFLDVLITKYGKHFEWIELWNEPNDPASGTPSSTRRG